MSKRNRRNASKRRNSKRNNIGKIIASITVPVMLVAAGVFAAASYKPQEKADAHYCFQRDNQHKTAIFIDNSLRELTDSQIRDYRTGLLDAYAQAPVNSKIMFYSTASNTNSSLAKPVFSICKPAQNTQQLASINAPKRPLAYVERKKNDAFAKYSQAIDSTMQTVLNNDLLAPNSPILEQLRSITISNDFSSNTSRSLILITDGIQNSHFAQFCKLKNNMPPYDLFKHKKGYNLSIKPRSLENTEVTLLMVKQADLPSSYYKYCTSDELLQWWVTYFEKNHTSSVNLTQLSR